MAQRTERPETELGFIGCKISASLKKAFSNFCFDRHISKSEVLRQLIESVLSGEVIQEKRAE